MKNNQDQHFYRAEKVTDHIDAIRSLTGEIMYLIHGSSRALLVDTCLGVGNLKKAVDRMTGLPYDVVITHGHVDHALGAPLFDGDHVFMNSRDISIYDLNRPLEKREGYIEANLGAAPGSWKDAEYVPSMPYHGRDLPDGTVFDLGGIHAEIYSLAGHTPGTSVVLIPEERILITGDAANTATFVFDEYALTLKEYRQNVIRIRDLLRGRYDRCFLMHYDMEASGQLLDNILLVIDDIFAGDTDDVPFEFMGGSYLLAKAAGEHMKRLDGGEGNIIYNRNKLGI
ncbi:MAG: MBL fold metallo-hydrolase [Bilifractor sp.]|jgi:hydroxyacylglutathione hydrolase